MRGPFAVVLTTLPTPSKARRLTKLILQKRLAACVNIIGPMESSFWWNKKIDRCKEYLLFIKTQASHFGRLKKLIETHHPYSVPEIICLPVKGGSAPYLNWIEQNVC